MGKIVGEIPEIERLFDTVLLQPEAASLIVDQARDLLILRNLQTLERGRQFARAEPETRSAHRGSCRMSGSATAHGALQPRLSRSDVEARISSGDDAATGR